MNEGAPLLWFHVTTILGMLAVVFINQMFQRRHHGSQRVQSEQRLRLALHAELQSLRRVYEQNLRLIGAQSVYVLSARPFTCVYMGNLARLTLLDELTIPVVIAAYSASEMIEGRLAGYARSGNPMVRHFQLDPSDLQDVKRHYVRVLATLVPAIEALAPFDHIKTVVDLDKVTNPVRASAAAD
jgi:hypothetical protein